MTNSPNGNDRFLSQKLVERNPQLLPLPPNHRERHPHNINIILHQHDNKSKTNDAYEAVTWQWQIEASFIPTMNVYYMLETTSITLKNTPLPVVQFRMSNFLRIQSISYTYDATAVRLDCLTSNMLRFVVQFWRVGGGPNNDTFEDPNQALILELQRRQGSAIEMQSIRRKMFRALTTGEQPAAPSDDEQLKQHALPATLIAAVDAKYDHDAGRADALEICLRLMESRCFDQKTLGLESLRMLTEPTIVSYQDARVVSRAIAFGEGEFGERLQTVLAGCFGVATAGESDVDCEDDMGHNLGLAILNNALQLVADDRHKISEENKGTIDPADPFWSLVAQDLFHNVEEAVKKPNEGALSAKCIRLLNDINKRAAISTTPQVPTLQRAGLRSCLTEAHLYGQRRHLFLERESQKLLDMDTDGFLRAH